MKTSAVVLAVLCLACHVQGVTLSYTNGLVNGTYNATERIITASHDGQDIWRMSLWLPTVGDRTAHDYWSAGEVIGFWDLQHDPSGTNYNYSPERLGQNIGSHGLFRFGEYADKSYTQLVESASTFQFTKGETVTHVTLSNTYHTIVVTISAGTADDTGFTIPITATYTVSNINAATGYDAWFAGGDAGEMAVSMNPDGLTNWALVNPEGLDPATDKPHDHLDDPTDGHPLFTFTDWHGSTNHNSFGGYYRITVKDSVEAQNNQMRAGMYFEMTNDCDFYYCNAANNLYGGTALSTIHGVGCRNVGQPGCFGSGVTLQLGETVTMTSGLMIVAPRDTVIPGTSLLVQ